MLKPLDERLAERIDCSGGPTACWPWIGYTSGNDGYGSLYVGRARKAHALVLEEWTGEPAAGRKALHSCDNPPCCNPTHLRWGTNRDNAKDREDRGRRKILRGEAHGCAKLSAEQVADIRRRHTPRHPQHSALALSREFGVDNKTIHHILKNKTWRV